MFRAIGFSYLHVENNVLTDSTYIALNHINTPLMGGVSQTKIAGLGLLKSLLASCNGVIMHNAQYDLGCLLTLGIDIKDLKVYDTKIIACLYDNTNPSFSLDPLSKKYLPSEQQKGINILLNTAIKGQLCPDLLPKRYKKGFTFNIEDPASSLSDASYKKIKDWCYSSMDIIQEYSFSAMSEYACLDTVATANLFLKFVDLEVENENT